MKKINKVKIIYISTVLVVLITAFVICFLNKKYDLCIGEYDYIRQDGQYTTMSYLQINEDKTFVYSINGGNSPWLRPEGVYDIKGNKLILLSDDGEFEFTIKDKKLILDKGSEYSDEYIGNGAEYIFELIDWGY